MRKGPVDWRFGKQRFPSDHLFHGFARAQGTSSSKSSKGNGSGSNNATNSNNNNYKSNNSFSKFEADNVKVTVINYQNVYADMAVPGRASSVPPNPSSSSSTTSVPGGDNSDSSASTAHSLNAASPQMHPPPALESQFSFNPPKLKRSDFSRRLDSVRSGMEYPVPRPIESNLLENYMPKDTEKYIQVYMSTVLFGSNKIIPLWNPSPGSETDPQRWRDHIDIGDVGFFNNEGGFDTLFNIFLSMDENHNRHYIPPDNFVRYAKGLEINFQDVALPPLKTIRASGFADLPEADESTLIGHSRHVNAAQCSVLYLRSGYRSASIRSVDKPGVLEYVQRHQESWKLYVDHRFAGQPQDRPLLVIFSCLRAKTCALAAGARRKILKSWKPKLTLRELIEGDHKSYVWDTNDNEIQTKFSPSRSFRESLEVYVRDMDCNAAARRELEECHCVAVGAYSVQKKGWLRGGSETTGRSSITTVKQLFSRMSLPTHFNSSIREETGY